MSMTKALRLAALGAFGVVLALGVACASGVPKADYDKVQQQLKDKSTESQQLQEKLTAAQKAAPAASPAGATAVKTLIGAVKKTPAPAPTPLPAGAEPPPAPPRDTPPAAYYQKVGDYFVYAETLATTTASKYNIASDIACTPSGVFQRGQK